MESSVEASQTGGITKPKPALATKPRLTPKPFSPQKNTTIRSIQAPKTVTVTSKTTAQQSGKSDAPVVPRPTFPTPVPKPTTSDSKHSSVSALTKDQPKITKESKASSHGEEFLDPRAGKPESSVEKIESSVGEPKSAGEPESSTGEPESSTGEPESSAGEPESSAREPKSAGKAESSAGEPVFCVEPSDPAQQTTSPKKTLESELIKKENDIPTNHKASTGSVPNSEQEDGKKKEDETLTSVARKPEELGSDVSSTANPINRRDSTRKRLSAELTSKFESGGLSLPPQPNITISKTSAKDEANKAEPSVPEQNQATPNSTSDEGGLPEDYGGGGSIKRRISRLFDSSSRPEVTTKKEEPELINGTGGVKARIKNWATEINSVGPKIEKKPQDVSQPKSPKR